ncbi:MAG TPA: hypothetical protein VK176_00330 [Phycisphaerales bacterium]|nr:hypothetical protein [Phycisphaerales bacterium]
MACSRTSDVIGARGFSKLIAAGLIGLTAATASADRLVVFTDDFESTDARPHWKGAKIDSADGLGRFAGRLTDRPVDLTLTPPPENQSKGGRVTYYMRFDLFTLDGWTGKTADGKDMRFEVKVGERVMFSHSLASLGGEGTFRKASIGPEPIAFGAAVDSVYRGVVIAFQLNADENLDVQFRALGLESSDFEGVKSALGGSSTSTPSWGIDNVEIWCEYDHEGATSAGREAETPLMGAVGGAAGGGDNGLATSATSGSHPPISTYKIPEPKELLPPGGGGGGGGGSSHPTVVPPFTPPEVTPPTQERKTESDPGDENPSEENNPQVPAPGTALVFGLAAATGLRRRRGGVMD